METKSCACGKRMILRRTGNALLSMPPQWVREWWCACGRTEPAEPERDLHPRNVLMKQWEEAQDNG